MATVEEDSPAKIEFFAKPEHLRDVRRQVERVAAKTSLSRTEVEDLLTAVDEAVANAIRHGSPHGERDVIHVLCRPFPDAVFVDVEDQGGGFSVPRQHAMPGPDAMGGRGLPLMVALADAVEIVSSPRGTRITLKKTAGNRMP